MGPWGRMHCGPMGMPFLTPSRPLSSPSSHPGPFLGHTPTGPSWVVQPAKDTDRTWATSYILYVFDRCMFLTFSQTTTQEKYLETQFNFQFSSLFLSFVTIINKWVLFPILFYINYGILSLCIWSYFYCYYQISFISHLIFYLLSCSICLFYVTHLVQVISLL